MIRLLIHLSILAYLVYFFFNCTLFQASIAINILYTVLFVNVIIYGTRKDINKVEEDVKQNGSKDQD